MLCELAVRNLILIEEARLALVPGLNVLTGETGAGKSIVAGGLALVAGARGTKAHVRRGAPSASIEATFRLHDGKALAISRTIAKSGRSRCRIDDRSATLPELATVAGELIEITSQHAHQSLCSPRRQLELLDAFAGGAGEARTYRALYSELEAGRSALRQREQERAAHELALDRARHELAELAELEPEPFELTALDERLELLRDARSLGEIAGAVSEVLSHDESGLSRLAALARRLGRSDAQSAALARLAEALSSAVTANELAAHAARQLEDELTSSPGELAELEDRRSRILDACRKHGVDADALPTVRSSLERRLAEAAGSEESERELRARVHALEAACNARARALHRRRARAAPDLASAIERELAALCMASARIEVKCEKVAELSHAGQSRVELSMAANPGEPMASLARVASGGELSRVLLAIESAVASQGSAVSRVFDEVDAGVGGTVADAIGERLARMARTRQVVCVTHLPQIAAFAEAHFVVEKRRSGERTVTRVRRLLEHERTAELARMLGGSESSALAHAQALLDKARELGVRRARPARDGSAAAVQARAV